LAEIAGPAAALAEIERLDRAHLKDFAPFHALYADLLARLNRTCEAKAAYDHALALDPGPAERMWLERRRTLLATD
jgi:RNA polymerase sigma-70 factor (ECF subfamily)